MIVVFEYASFTRDDFHSQRRISMRAFGRLLQIVGLTLPPLSIMLQLSDAIRTGPMLAMLVASVSMFYLGRIIEGYARG